MNTTCGSYAKAINSYGNQSKREVIVLVVFNFKTGTGRFVLL